LTPADLWRHSRLATDSTAHLRWPGSTDSPNFPSVAPAACVSPRADTGGGLLSHIQASPARILLAAESAGPPNCCSISSRPAFSEDFRQFCEFFSHSLSLGITVSPPCRAWVERPRGNTHRSTIFRGSRAAGRRRACERIRQNTQGAVGPRIGGRGARIYGSDAMSTETRTSRLHREFSCSNMPGDKLTSVKRCTSCRYTERRPKPAPLHKLAASNGRRRAARRHAHSDVAELGSVRRAAPLAKARKCRRQATIGLSSRLRSKRPPTKPRDRAGAERPSNRQPMDRHSAMSASARRVGLRAASRVQSGKQVRTGAHHLLVSTLHDLRRPIADCRSYREPVALSQNKEGGSSRVAAGKAYRHRHQHSEVKCGQGFRVV